MNKGRASKKSAGPATDVRAAPADLLDSAAPSPFAEVPLCAQRLLAALMTQGLGLQKVHVAVGTQIKRLQAQPALRSQLGSMSSSCA
jgi:hypothetical protein